ncbi:MAG: OstA-like protein [Bacteroidota bacterium]
MLGLLGKGGWVLGQVGVPKPMVLEPDSSLSKPDSAVSRVKIINADLLTFQLRNDTALQKLIGRVRLVQDSTYFYCDSALFFDTENMLKAYGRVRIEMPNEVSLKAKRLTYDGNTRIAEVYENILLTNQNSELTTDRLTYYRAQEYGYYQEGGELVDDETVLTSETGYYYPNQKLAYFRDSVVLTHPDYTLYTDTLAYNSKAKLAQFVTKTLIYSKDGEIETTNGTYATQKSYVDLYERSVVRDSSFTLTADTLSYNNDQNFGQALGRVIVYQEDSSLEIRGNYGQFNRKSDESLLTDRAVAIQRFDEDTLYIFADTLFSLKDSQFIAKKSDLATPDEVPPDTTFNLDTLAADTLFTDTLSIDTLASLVEALPQPDTLVEDSVISQEVMDQADFPGSGIIREPQPLIPDTRQEPLSPLDSILQTQDSSALRSDSSLVTPQLDTTMVAAAPTIEMGPPTELEFEQQWDTVVQRVFKGHPNVRFFMNEMQGKADSMLYLYDDSIFYLNGDPVLWSDENQLTGDQVAVWMKNETADSMEVNGNSFMASKADSIGFNQLKGRDMQVRFIDGDLYRMRVLGNSESIYFVEQTQDSAAEDAPAIYQGMNQALADQMEIYFEDNEVVKILFLSNPEGSFKPIFEVIFQENKLDGMRWRIEERPIKPFWLLPPPPILPVMVTLPPVDLKPLIKLPPVDENAYLTPKDDQTR